MYRVIPLGEINKSEDIISILFDYVLKHFNDFGHQNTVNHRDTGHQNTDWWWHNRFVETGSWSPFVETCFIIYGRENLYQIHHDYTHPNITTFMWIVHHEKYDGSNKCTIQNLDNKSDINLLYRGNIILSVEHEEKGNTKELQLENILNEIDKLKKNTAEFKVLISRPVWFNKHTADEGYFKSVDVYRDKIQEYLNNKVTLNESENWLIILIAPSPDINPTEIIFHCYEWTGNKLADLDERHIQIKPKDIKKWIINET